MAVSDTSWGSPSHHGFQYLSGRSWRLDEAKGYPHFRKPSYRLLDIYGGFSWIVISIHANLLMSAIEIWVKRLRCMWRFDVISSLYFQRKNYLLHTIYIYIIMPGPMAKAFNATGSYLAINCLVSFVWMATWMVKWFFHYFSVLVEGHWILGLSS